MEFTFRLWRGFLHTLDNLWNRFNGVGGCKYFAGKATDEKFAGIVGWVGNSSNYDFGDLPTTAGIFRPLLYCFSACGDILNCYGR